MLQIAGATDNRDETISDLESEVESLKAALAHEKQAGREGARAVAALRKQLTPLYQALQVVFGHMESVGGSEDASTPASSGMNARIEAYKRQLGQSCAKVIDVLLVHGELNVEGIRINAKMSPNTVYRCTSQLQRAGAVVKNGGRFSLKH